MRATNTSSAATTDRHAVLAVADGSLDVTAASRFNFAVHAAASATRSAGANSVANVGGFFTASGGQSNQAIRTSEGDVLLNVDSGSTTLFTTGSVLGGTANVDVFTAANPNTGQTGNDKSVVLVTNSGSYDCTGSALETRGITSSVTATRSAGANTLTNYAALFSASGAQTNWALYTESGDVNHDGNLAVGGDASVTGLLEALDDCTVDGLLSVNPGVIGLGSASIISGAGSPEGAVAAPRGSLFLRTDGDAGSGALYVKQTGAGTTGWVLK
jgi:hypothetical protein